jgi:hypothetical protein
VVLLGGCDRAGVSVDTAKKKKAHSFLLGHLHINWGTVVDTSGLCVIYLGACSAVECDCTYISKKELGREGPVESV